LGNHIRRTLELFMPPRILIPEPASLDADYSRRALPPYLEALRASGAEPVVVSLDETQSQIAHLLADCLGCLLPGSKFDVDPQSYGQQRQPECADADPARTAVDELLLQDAFNLQRPILAICYGVQALNVWRGGSLVQDLKADLKTSVNHSPGRSVADAHSIRIAPRTRLAALLPPSEPREPLVNSSHHQALLIPGDNLIVSAVCPQDGVIEAVELDSAEHFAVGVQWHAERTFASSPLSRALFSSFVRAAVDWQPRPIEASVARR
jgi:putative glutamine amidotransferase